MLSCCLLLTLGLITKLKSDNARAETVSTSRQYHSNIADTRQGTDDIDASSPKYDLTCISHEALQSNEVYSRENQHEAVACDGERVFGGIGR